MFVSCFTLVSLLRCYNRVFSNCSRASARIPVAESKAERLLDVPARTRAESAVQTALAAQSSCSARKADSKASRRKTQRLPTNAFDKHKDDIAKSTEEIKVCLETM